jgi:hypothetical protein
MYAYLPLCREVTVTSGDTAKDTIELGEFGGADDRVVGLGGSMHLCQNVLRQSLGNPNDEYIRRHVSIIVVAVRKLHSLIYGGATTSSLDTALLGLSH